MSAPTKERTDARVEVTPGELKLTLAVFEPGNTASYRIGLDAFGAYVPNWRAEPEGVGVYYADGSMVLWPWTSLLNVHFSPPVRADSSSVGAPSVGSRGAG